MVCCLLVACAPTGWCVCVDCVLRAHWSLSGVCWFRVFVGGACVRACCLVCVACVVRLVCVVFVCGCVMVVCWWWVPLVCCLLCVCLCVRSD